MKIWKIVFTIWVVVWVLFLARGLYKKGLAKYLLLISQDNNGRMASVIGKDLYDFIQSCKKKMPESATYRLTGEYKPIDRIRLIYHLYPRMESPGAAYILRHNNGRFSLNKRGR